MIPYSTRYFPNHRIVHLDLKGAPPKLSYILSIIPLIKEAGGTGLLIEYEDMFPFWGNLRNISARNCYSEDDIRKIQASATQNNLVFLHFEVQLESLTRKLKCHIYFQDHHSTRSNFWSFGISP